MVLLFVYVINKNYTISSIPLLFQVPYVATDLSPGHLVQTSLW